MGRRGAFGKSNWFPDPEEVRRREPIHTGILCPFCREGELLVEHDPGQTRWGGSGFYVSCSNNPRQGAICPWIEQTRYDGQPISEEERRAFLYSRGDLDRMGYLLRQSVPALGEARLEPFPVEEIHFAYGPPVDYEG